MPRSLQQILDQADERAEMFENYDPSDEDRIGLDELRIRRLRQAVLARATAERIVTDAVCAARREGVSWARIAEAIGISPQATYRRYSRVVSA